MNPHQKAADLITKFSERIYPSIVINPKHEVIHRCIVCVKEIINAIEITTWHCELRAIDLNEVHSDIDYWNRVIKALEKNKKP